MTEETPLTYPFGDYDRLSVHPKYKELRKQDGLGCIQPPFGNETWIATRYEDIKTVLIDPRFSRAQAIGEDEPRVHPYIPQPDELTAMDPPEHTRLRRVLASGLTTKRAEEVRPQIQKIVDRLLDKMEDQGGPIDLVENFSQPMPVEVMCQLLGVPPSDTPKFKEWAGIFLSTAAAGVSQEEMMQKHMELMGYLSGMIAQRREKPTEDMLSVLVNAHDVDERLTEREMLNLAFAIIVAGYETTANQIASFTYVLLSNPDKLQMLRANPDLMPHAIEELLRIAPVTATAGFARVATEDVKLGDFLVKKGETVMPVLFSANDDESVFPNPEELDFTRENVHVHMSFSHGPHHCPGAQLARVELQIAIKSLIERFPNLAFAIPAEDIPWKTGHLARGPLELPVTW